PLVARHLAEEPPELAVHEREETRAAPEARHEAHREGALRAEHPVRLRVHEDVGAAEPVDRLLRVADDRHAPRPQTDLPPVPGGGAVLAEEEDDLALEGVGVLELVHEDVGEERLEAPARFPVTAQEVAEL